MPPVTRRERTTSSLPVLNSTRGGESRPAQTTGFSGNSTFTATRGTGPSNWARDVTYIREGVEALRTLRSPAARRAVEILSRGTVPTKEELEELGGADGAGGLIGQLKGQLSAADLKKVKDANSMMGVLKGFIAWMANTMFVGAR